MTFADNDSPIKNAEADQQVYEGMKPDKNLFLNRYVDRSQLVYGKNKIGCDIQKYQWLADFPDVFPCSTRYIYK